jgi:hypothetical protein
MLNDISFFQNDQITGISETNNDFIPQLNSEDNIISSPIHYSTELQDNINSLIEGDDNISENIYFNKNPTLNNLIPSVKKDIKINEKTVSTNERKNNCNNTIYGRKKKNSIEKRNHTKFAFDNTLRKIKTLAIRSYQKFINNKIKYIYRNSNKKIKWILEKINQKNVANAKIDFNRDYLNKTFKSIFSEDITTKWKTKTGKHNKNVIEHLLKEKDTAKREIFVKLLNFKLIDIIKYLRGEREDYEELNGLEFDLFSWNNITKDEEYFKFFKSNMMQIETNLKNKFSRNRKNNKF